VPFYTYNFLNVRSNSLSEQNRVVIRLYARNNSRISIFYTREGSLECCGLKGKFIMTISKSKVTYTVCRKSPMKLAQEFNIRMVYDNLLDVQIM